MPDQRRHRGRHPADSLLFAAVEEPVLRQATADLSWLLERGYSQGAALKLVGDHLGLRERQRLAVLRSACGESVAAERRQRASDCMAQCDAGREPPVSGPMDRPAYSHDTRTDCERRCQ